VRSEKVLHRMAKKAFLKGQCHEMVVEMSLWSSSLGLTNGCATFFLFKNRPSQSYSQWSNTSIDVLQIRQILLRLGFKLIGISHCDDCDMPMVTQPLCKLPTVAILFFARTAASLWSIFHGSS
jgi:hypothetical protein